MESDLNTLENGEIRFLIRFYLNLNRQIEKLKQSKALVSPEYYASHSFIGLSCYDRDLCREFQSSISPEYGAMEIIAKENAIQSRIDRLERRYKEFEPKLADLPPLAIRELKSANGDLSEKEIAYYNVIAGIEAGFEEKRKQALRLTVKQYKDSLRK